MNYSNTFQYSLPFENHELCIHFVPSDGFLTVRGCMGRTALLPTCGRQVLFSHLSGVRHTDKSSIMERSMKMFPSLFLRILTHQCGMSFFKCFEKKRCFVRGRGAGSYVLKTVKNKYRPLHQCYCYTRLLHKQPLTFSLIQQYSST